MPKDKENEILRRLKPEDVPEGCEVLLEYLTSLDLEAIKNEAYFVGDGLDLFRYLVKHLGGLPFRLPRVKSLQGAHIRYLKDRISTEPAVSVRRLVFETKLDEKTVREYLRMIK